MGLWCAFCQADIVIPKSGKPLEGDIVYQDDKTVRIEVEQGIIQLEKESIERILIGKDALDFKSNTQLPTPEVSSGMLKILDKRTAEGLSVPTLQAIEPGGGFTLGQLVDPPTQEGNAGQYYWSLLSTGSSLENLETQSGWNFSHPVFKTIRLATRLKGCSLYPDFLPYPSGLFPPLLRIGRLTSAAKGMIYLGNLQISKGEVEEGLANLEAALIMGVQLQQNPLRYNLFFQSCDMQILAAEALAEYYHREGNREKNKTLLSFSKFKERESTEVQVEKLRLIRMFNAGKITDLMDYATKRTDDLHRSYVMRLLTLHRLAAERQPLSKKVQDIIPAESRNTLLKASAADAQRINAMLVGIKQQGNSPFLTDHADKLLAARPTDLERAIKTLLADHPDPQR